MNTKLLGSILLLAVVAVGVYLILKHPVKPVQQAATSVTATFYCAENKSITGTFDTSSVALKLSDGRAFTLPQGPSGSGVRYEATTTAGVDTVFWNKGDNAFLTENDMTTYDKCVAAVIVPVGNNIYAYADVNKTFAFQFPNGFVSSGVEMGYTPSWSYMATTSGLELAAASVGKEAQPGTNFSDARFTVGTSVDPSAIADCTKPYQGEKLVGPVTINNVQFTEFTARDAAAGNRYDTTSYRTMHGGQCWAVEYTIHYGVLENYDPSMHVKAFDEAAVAKALDAIAHTFTFLK